MPIELVFNLYVSPCVGDIFQFYGSHIPRRYIESMEFYSCFSSPSKIPCRIFWKSVFLKTKRVEETIICFIQIQLENLKMTETLIYLNYFTFFVWFVVFFKCDGFTVLWIISIRSVILHLLSLICNHGNFTLKLYASEKITRYLNEGRRFISRFKVGSLPRMKNKEVLANLYINLANQLKNCLPRK